MQQLVCFNATITSSSLLSCVYVTADRLSAYDYAICCVFAYKVSTHMTDASFEKLPYAFPSEPPLPKINKVKSHVRYLAGIKPKYCPNSCCCYTGPHVDLQECPYCKQPRFCPDGRARKKFTYIPLVSRLVAFAGNRPLSEQMQYHGCEHKHTLGMTKDVFDGKNYCRLWKRKVKLAGKVYNHKYFADNQDIALGLSTNGFAPFKKRKSTTWPLIIFNYNLPPDICFHLNNILSLGVIPGPKEPIDVNSFLWPLLQELFKLSAGVRAFDILTGYLLCMPS